MKTLISIFMLIVFCLLSVGCNAVYRRDIVGFTFEKDTATYKIVYETSIDDLNQVFFGALRESSYTSYPPPMWERTLLLPFCMCFSLIDLPFSFVAESSILLPRSLETAKTIRNKNSNQSSEPILNKPSD